MISELFHIGPISIYSYGVCMATGFLLAWTLAGRLCRKNGDDPDFLSHVRMLEKNYTKRSENKIRI